MTSYQQQFSIGPYAKAALATHAHFKDLQILAVFLSIYDDILNTPRYTYDQLLEICNGTLKFEKKMCTYDELLRIGFKLVDNLPNGHELKGKASNDFRYFHYKKYMSLAFLLDRWIENLDSKVLANFILSLMVFNKHIDPNVSFEILWLINEKYLSLKDVDLVLEAVYNNPIPVHEIIEQLGIEQIDCSTEILKIISELIAISTKEVQQYVNGNDKILGFFVGKVMKQLTTKTDPAEINRLLRIELDKLK